MIPDKVLNYCALVMGIVLILIFLFGCCDPNRAKVHMRPFLKQPEITLKGYDWDCDGELDYWQHYKNGKPFGNRIYIRK